MLQTSFLVEDIEISEETPVGGLSARDAIVQAGADWTVRKEQAFFNGKPIKGVFWTVRDDTNMVLGVVGQKYHPIQNTEAFSFLDLVSKEGAFFVGAGVFDGGKTVWAQLKLPGEFYVTRDDRIEQRILLAWSHNGSLSYTAAHTPYRVRCKNSLNYALSRLDDEDNTLPVVRIQHTRSAAHEIKMAHHILGIATRRGAILGQIFQRLAQVKIGPADVNDLGKVLFPSKPEDEGGEATAHMQKLRDALMTHYLMEVNNPDEAIDTAWSAYNAVTGLVDHQLPTKTDRKKSAWFGRGAALKNKALKWLAKKHLGIDL